MLENGTYTLCGIEEFSREDEWNGDTIEGVRIILNDKVYEMYYDPDDGYRSYGHIFLVDTPTTEIKFRFPPQLVEVRVIEEQESDDYGFGTDYHGYSIFDAKNGKLVFEIGTDYADNYYPVGHFSYYPENLSINENR